MVFEVGLPRAYAGRRLAAIGMVLMKATALKCFELTIDEQKDKNMLVRFADRVPSVAGGGDHRVKQRLDFARKAFMRNLNILWRNPSLNDACCSWLQEQTSEEVQLKLQGQMLENSSTLGTIDDTFASEVVVELTKLSKAALEQAASEDPEVLKQIVQYMFVSSRSLVIPVEYRDKRAIGPVLKNRSQQVVRRAGLLTDSDCILSGNKKFTWKNVSVYMVTWNKNLVTGILHQPSGGNAKVGEDDGITTKYKMVKPWSDFGCVVKLRHLMQPLHAFFDDNQGPHKIKQWVGNDLDLQAKL